MSTVIKINDKKELSDLSKRFMKVFEEKKYTGYRFSKDFPDLLEGTVTKIRTGRVEPSKVYLTALLQKFPDLSNVWLLTGEGEMLKDSKQKLKSEIKEVGFDEKFGVPIYDIDFTAGDVNVFNDDAVEIIGYLNIPELRCSEKIIRARGDSMLGIIDDRDFIGIKRIKDFSFFNYGSPYAIVTENYRFLKFIRKSENPDNIILRSNNPEYDDIELAKEKILELHIIIAVLPFSKIKTFM